jgi:translation initiation factor eIF-2B subunit beta
VRLVWQLENMYGEICELALEHIHANEVILTSGRSRTIERFLKVREVRRTVRDGTGVPGS